MNVGGPRIPNAVILTVGTELVTGLRVDTNSAEIALALEGVGYHVAELVSVGDDLGELSAAIGRLTTDYEAVVVTGGLGPTHDDVTREAVAAALGLELREDAEVAERLRARAWRHTDARAAEQVFRQALVPVGATVVTPTVGTAPGLLVPTARGLLALLPGPPREMRSMLPAVLEALGGGERSGPAMLSCALLSESDAQVRALEALGDTSDIRLTVLAKSGDVQVLLFDEGAGPEAVAAAAERVRASLGDSCYSYGGASLAETVLALARGREVTLATAESCTGGLVGAALTDAAGSSASYMGGVVSYSNGAKVDLLGVAAGTLAAHGAVSEQTAREMALGVRERLHADLAVSVTGIAGPDGGTPDKPVGLVWFGFADAQGATAESRVFRGDRTTVRTLATVYALDGLRRRLAR